MLAALCVDAPNLVHVGDHQEDLLEDLLGITNSAQHNEAPRSHVCAPAYLGHASGRGHTWPPLGVTRGRGQDPGCESHGCEGHGPTLPKK